MTKEKFLKILGLYEAVLISSGYQNVEANHDSHPSGTDAVTHLRSMMPNMREFIEEPTKREKAMRWLGFMQGVLWVCKIFTLKEMRDHNRS